MSFEKFNSEGLEPIGEGGEKEVYVNPDNPEEVIAQMKEMPEAGEMLQLKGTFYLTKIVHELLPNMIPDVHRVGESEDDRHTIVSDRIPHTPEYTNLVEAVDDDVRTPEEIEYSKTHRDGISAVDDEIHAFGLAFAHDSNLLNYAEDENGTINYLESFKPWNLSSSIVGELDVSFDETELWKVIDPLEKAGEERGKRCAKWMKRLLILQEEAEIELKALQESSLPEAGPVIEELEQLFAEVLDAERLDALHAIESQEDAESDKDRMLAIEQKQIIWNKIQFLAEKTNIPSDKLKELEMQQALLVKAIGSLVRPKVDGKFLPTGGTIDHTR